MWRGLRLRQSTIFPLCWHIPQERTCFPGHTGTLPGFGSFDQNKRPTTTFREITKLITFADDKAGFSS